MPASMPTFRRIPELIDAKIRRGSRNATREPALTMQEARDGLARGASIVAASIEAGTDIVAIGEMGIGNTTSAALLMHRLAPAPLADCVGAGTGLDAAGIARKLAVAERAAARSNATSPLEVLVRIRRLRDRDDGRRGAWQRHAPSPGDRRRLYCLGGGVGRGAAAAGGTRLLRVFASLRRARSSISCSRRSTQNHISISGLRLGEGTGAVMAVPLLRAAGGMLTEMADLSDVMAGTLKPWSADRRHG